MFLFQSRQFSSAPFTRLPRQPNLNQKITKILVHPFNCEECQLSKWRVFKVSRLKDSQRYQAQKGESWMQEQLSKIANSVVLSGLLSKYRQFLLLDVSAFTTDFEIIQLNARVVEPLMQLGFSVYSSKIIRFKCQKQRQRQKLENSSRESIGATNLPPPYGTTEQT